MWSSFSKPASPGGSSGQAQYNNAGAFGGFSGLTVGGGALTAISIAEAVGTSGLTIVGATQVANNPALNISQTWNNAGVTFDAAVIDTTPTAAGAFSKALNFKNAGTSVMYFRASDGACFNGATTLSAFRFSGGNILYANDALIITPASSLMNYQGEIRAQAIGNSNYLTISNNGTISIITDNGGSGIRLGSSGGNVGFYGTSPVALQTGVAVTAAGIHAALVNLGLITA